MRFVIIWKLKRECPNFLQKNWSLERYYQSLETKDIQVFLISIKTSENYLPRSVFTRADARADAKYEHLGNFS